MTKITPLRLPICNAFLLRDSRAILLDTGAPTDPTQIRDLLAKEGQALEDLTLILHTHAHWDHCGGTLQLKQWTKAPTAVHRADADKMRRGDNGILQPVGWAAWALKPFLDRRFPGVEADILLDGETDLSPYGVEARVITTPGHTAGSISVVTAAGEAIVGDLFMGGFWGGKLLPGYPTYHYFAEDFDMLRKSIRKLLDLSPTRIFAGHGGPLDPARVARRFGL